MTTSAYPSHKKVWLFLKHSSLIDIIKFLVVVGAMIWFMGRSTERLGYNWQWYRVPRYLFSFKEGQFIAGPLIKGLMVTFRITGVSLLLAFTFGLVTALFRLSNSFVAQVLARGYMELIRSTPRRHPAC